MKIFSNIQNISLKLCIIISALFISVAAKSQELDPTVEVNLDRISIDVRDRLLNFKQDVQNYLVKNRFTDEIIINDVKGKQYKIKCTFQFFFQSATGQESYSAQVFVGIQRNIFKTPNFTSMVKFLDENWDFTYVKGQTLYRDDLKFNNLTTFLDYYAFMIIGLDDDSWEPSLGNKRFQKAQDMVNLAVSNGTLNGWSNTSITKSSRGVFTQELLNSKYDDFRKGYWMYHFAGIDSLQYGKRQALERIAEAISMIGKVKKSEIRSFIIKAFFDTKYLEIAQVMTDYYDKTIYRKLSEIDPDHFSTYDEYSKK